MNTRQPSSSVPRTGMPRLSLKERDARWARIRKDMAAQGIDCLLVCGDSGKWDQKSPSMRYVGHIGGNGEDGWLVFPLDGEPVAFVFAGGAMLQMWKDLQDWVTDVRTAPGLQWSHFLIRTVKERGLERGCLGLVGLTGYQEAEGIVPHTTFQRLEAELPHARLVDASSLVEDLRMFKSEEEIAFIEQAVLIGDQAIQVMRQVSRPGVPEYEAYARTFAALLEAGSEQPITFFWDSGKSVSHGQRFPARRILEAGDVIVTEISPRYFGYWSHHQAPVAVGSPADLLPEYGKLFEIAHEAYMSALEVLRPGIVLGEVAAAFERPIRAAGATSQHVYAHGTGGRGSEFPVILPPSRREGMSGGSLAAFERLMQTEVRPGLVLAFEPHVTLDGVHGLHLGDPVVVTDRGCRRLSQRDLRDWFSVLE